MSLGIPIGIAAIFDMVPPSPSMHGSDISREASPLSFDPLNMPRPASNANVDSPLLKLPDDIFKCVMDYLDGSAAWSLKRVCRGMANHITINRLVYRYPIQLSEVRDLRLADWKYRGIGSVRWEGFKRNIDDSNRGYVQKLAISHWASIDDFRWIEASLPALTSLDLSAIKDFVWTPEETWTWKMLAEACPKLFARLEELEVANWADYTAHSRIEYSYSYNDYRFKPKFRISRRRDGCSVAQAIFPLCEKLKTLAIRERYSGFHTWNEWEVHQRVCCLVDGIERYCPPTMTKLRVHDYAPYRSIFATDATEWSKITDVEIGLYSWMEDRRDRDVIGPIPYRITQGTHHRNEEDAFDDKTYDTCQRNHMSLGNDVVQGVGASFEDLLQSLQAISNKYPKIKFKPIRNLQNITIHPFHLVNVVQRRHQFGPVAHVDPRQGLTDPVANEVVQKALCWLAEECEWKPILAWDSMMCDVFPANLEPTRTFLPKLDVLSRIKSMVSTLRRLNIPIRILIGDRHNTCPSSGLDGSLYFGDFKGFVGEEADKHEVLLPTQAAFNLSPIADMVDELTIQYPHDVPGVVGWHRTGKRPTSAEKALMQREMIGWRRFWVRYASQFQNLKKLTAKVPNEIYEDWGKSELAGLLADKRWDMLETPERDCAYGMMSNYWPLSSIRYSFARKLHHRTTFVERTFFRLDNAPLNDSPVGPNYNEREERQITDDEIKDIERPTHRFWPAREADKKEGKKRKRDDVAEDTEEVAGLPYKKKMVTAADALQQASRERFELALDRLMDFD